MVERIVLVGAGAAARTLLGRLTAVAPTVVIDTSEDALERATARPAAGSAEERALRHPVTTQLADGSSRLVLEDLRGNPAEAVALVAGAGDDRTNLEVCRLGSELGYSPLVAIAHEPESEEEYRSYGAQPIMRASLLGDVVERALRFEGMAVASNIGLGKGDVIEIRILGSSPAIGEQLAELKPEGWRVAAIYRGGELVIPTGTTTIENEDRVLLIGQPGILPYVAENLRKGVPDFPRRFGSTIVVFLPNGRDRDIEAEAEIVALRTRVAGLVHLYPGAKGERTLLHESLECDPVPGAGSQKWFQDHALEGETLDEQARAIFAHNPGVLVVRESRRPWGDRLLGRAGEDAKLCNLLSVPVLFPRGKPEYERVALVIAAEAGEAAAVDAAIDLARMLEISLHVLRVDPPQYFGRPDPRLDDLVAIAERRSRLYALSAKVTRLEGNPIRQILRFAQPDDLLVIGRTRGRRDSFTSPDVAMRIARKAPCSTLVLTL